jgi:hypothetical protein
MVLPIRGTQQLQTLIRDAVLRKELEDLTTRQQTFQQYRDYFDGEQPLAFSTELFQQIFGTAFEGFKDNWMRPIIDVVQDKLIMQGFKAEDKDNQDAVNAVWDVFRLNDIDEESFNLHEGGLVEGQSYMIVWPDEEFGATIDHQPGGLVRVRYDNDRRRQALWAVKRWQTDEGAIFVTIYTPDAAWKFVQQDENDANVEPSSTNAQQEIPGVGFISGLTPRDVPGEPFPLPHAFGRVPVVEFNNVSYRSEIKDAIPQQDALNKSLLDLLVAGEFAAVPQKYIETMANAPVDGWKTGAGEVWHLKPAFDADGRPVPSQFGSFDTMDPGNFIKTIEMFLQHIAFTSRTPVRYFMQSDRGGRGDAPSGESLQVEDKPLNDKVARKQRIWGNRWLEVARLVSTVIEDGDPAAFRLGETVWQDPRYDFRLAVIEEATAMINMGLPFKWVIRQMNLTQKEIDTIEELKEEEVEQQREQQREDLAMQQEFAPPDDDSDSNFGN